MREKGANTKEMILKQLQGEIPSETVVRDWKETKVQAMIWDSPLTRSSLSKQGEGNLISKGTVFSSLTRFPPTESESESEVA